VTTSGARKKNDQKGRRAEFWAGVFLRLKGYRILEKRFKCPVGEIDLIARKGDMIVFVEVKTRSTLTEALEVIDFQQKQRIQAAANWYLSSFVNKNIINKSFRFDGVFIVPFRWPVHIKDAWRE